MAAVFLLIYLWNSKTYCHKIGCRSTMREFKSYFRRTNESELYYGRHLEKWRPLRFVFAYNSGTVIRISMKFYSDVPGWVPRNILEERTNLIYITTAILENGDRYRFIAYNSGILIHRGMNLIQMFPEWCQQLFYKNEQIRVILWLPS
jgi:hypothetical protein